QGARREGHHAAGHRSGAPEDPLGRDRAAGRRAVQGRGERGPDRQAGRRARVGVIPMQSESARMASAAEARFRIDAPNSKPRAIKIIALDRQSDRVVKRLAEGTWNQASFFTASAFAGAPKKGESFSMTGWLSDLAGRTTDLVNEVNGADLV